MKRPLLPSCEVCGKKQPTWPAGWRFTDERVLCDECKDRPTEEAS